MSLIQVEREESRLTAIIEDIEQQVSDLKIDIRELQSRLRSGEVETVRDALKTLTEMRNWLRLALETEAKLNEEKRKELGIVGDSGLDLCAARDQIGCRLDRLRRAGCPAVIPE
jgi:nitrate reductase beta subunit